MKVHEIFLLSENFGQWALKKKVRWLSILKAFRIQIRVFILNLDPSLGKTGSATLVEEHRYKKKLSFILFIIDFKKNKNINKKSHGLKI